MSNVLAIIWKNWIKPLALYAILWAGFFYWLEFDNKRSMVFAILFGTCYYGFSALSKRTQTAQDFTPYRVSISIHSPYDLLCRYNLIQQGQEWDQVCEKVQETSILRRGLNFTVLSLSKDGLPHLIWWDDHKVFLAGIPSFEEAIQGLEFPSKYSVSRTWSPALYFGFRHGKGRGYNLALCVREKWWEENKTTDNIEIEKEYHTGSVYIGLGTLPYGEIGLDYEARRQNRKTELEKLGWAVKDYIDSEFSAWNTIEVQNTYFSVSQRFLETD